MCTITEKDFSQIHDLITRNDLQGKLLTLEQKLTQASIIETPPPESLIRMNSEVEMTDMSSGETFAIKLVYQALPFLGTQVSVLAPLGTALLGANENDSISYIGRDEILRTIVVRKILLQPNASELINA